MPPLEPLHARISIIIPTLRAEKWLPKLLDCLQNQTILPVDIVLVDSSSDDNTCACASVRGCVVKVISRSEFNHGGTRNLGVKLAKGNILVFMTQDVLPCDATFLETLTEPLRNGKAAAAYARQIPRQDAPPTEVFARAFNYPDAAFVKCAEDLPRMGVKTYFFSDAASAVRRDVFESVGAYPEHVIVNEDMFLCAKMLQAGQTVAYVAEARAYHSHHYTLKQQFRRYFDIGAYMWQSRDVMIGAKSGGEGIRYVRSLLTYLTDNGHREWVPFAAAECVCKFVGFKLGYNERHLPLSLKRRLSMHAYHWK